MTDRLPAVPSTIARAEALLRKGGLVAFPTETVYGLGADARLDRAVAALFSAKARPRFNPLIAHVDTAESARRQGLFGEAALRLAEAFWPGPLTLVVPLAPTCSVGLLARAGLNSVALRVPSHPVAQAILQATGVPIAAPSANRSGRVSPTEAAHVLAELDGLIDLLVDGGRCPIGLESTVVSCVGEPVLLRPGGVTRTDLEAVLGAPLAAHGPAADGAPVAPGMLASHYAPRAAVRLNALETRRGEAVLDFAGALDAWRDGAKAYRDLSPGGSDAEAAANLFAFLRELDESWARGIAVAPIPDAGLGEAVNDRLRRAAAPRS